METLIIDLPDVNCTVKTQFTSNNTIRTFNISVLDNVLNKPFNYYFKYVLQDDMHCSFFLQNTFHPEVNDYTKYKIIATNIIKTILKESGELNED